MKLLATFVMFCGLMFAQAPLTIFGDANIGGGHINPGVGVEVPITDNSNVPFEVKKYPGSVALTVGYTYNFYKIDKDSIGATFDIGGNFGRYHSYFVHEYALNYNKRINETWSVTPYVKYSASGYVGGWSAGLTFNYRWIRK